VHEVWIIDYSYFDIRAISRGSGRSDDEPLAKRLRFYNLFEATDRVVKPARIIAVIGDEYLAWQLDREISDSEVRDSLTY
jgi:hypothetical protein